MNFFKPRPDLLGPKSPASLEVFQLTVDPDVAACHVYMEAQIFTLDSKHFLLHRSAHPHGSDPLDPNHQYLRCDIESGTLTPVTDELGSTAPSVSPDGKCFYYFVVEGVSGGQRISLRRRNLDGSSPETISVIDGIIPGTPFRPSSIYSLSTISSDGRRLAISCFLGDHIHDGAPWGLLVFDLETGNCQIPLLGPSWGNMHAQYSRSLNPESSHDILVQENHRGALGIDVHVIRDDGQHFRNLPWGRDKQEFPQGHQCWRGRSEWVITTTNTYYPDPAGSEKPIRKGHFIESAVLPHDGHDGLLMKGGVRNRLCPDFEDVYFSHFATDLKGDRLITDCLFDVGRALVTPREADRDAIYLMDLGSPGAEPFRKSTYLLRPRSTWFKKTEIHPFLSPDGKTAFFNSDESGQLQAYMIRNLPESASPG